MWYAFYTPPALIPCVPRIFFFSLIHKSCLIQPSTFQKMPAKFLTIQQALDYFQELDSDDYSYDPKIVCLLPDPNVIADEEDIQENNLGEDFPRDVTGEVELSVNLKSETNQEKCHLI